MDPVFQSYGRYSWESPFLYAPRQISFTKSKGKSHITWLTIREGNKCFWTCTKRTHTIRILKLLGKQPPLLKQNEDPQMFSTGSKSTRSGRWNCLVVPTTATKHRVKIRTYSRIWQINIQIPTPLSQSYVELLGKLSKSLALYFVISKTG